MSVLRVFIVEDSPVIRDNLVGALEDLAPVQVVGWAADEDSALRAMQSEDAQPLDMVIIDIFLKSGSGIGVLRGLASHQVTFERVVLTNYATEDIRRECAQLGASRVFDKSTDIDALIDHCHALADARHC